MLCIILKRGGLRAFVGVSGFNPQQELKSGNTEKYLMLSDVARHIGSDRSPFIEGFLPILEPV